MAKTVQDVLSDFLDELVSEIDQTWVGESSVMPIEKVPPGSMVTYNGRRSAVIAHVKGCDRYHVHTKQGQGTGCWDRGTLVRVVR